MKLLVLCLVLVLCWSQAEAGGTCPPRNNNLKPEKDCERCKELFLPSSKFMLYCGHKLKTIVLNKLKKDCHKVSDTDAQWDAFIKNLQVYCETKKFPWTGTVDCPHVCDLCAQLFHPDSHFTDKCGQFLPDSVLNEYKYDCDAAAGSDVDFQDFMESLKDECDDRNLSDEFNFPECECDPCVKLQHLYGDFMTICEPKLPGMLFDLFIKTCYKVKDDSEQLWELWNKIEAICYYLTYEDIILPMCNCDVCHLLIQWDSDFMQTCGKFMSSSHLRCIMYECEEIKCDSAGRWDFMEWLKGECEHYGITANYEFPICECEECWELFDEKSVFMKNCGFYMSDAQLKSYRDDCFKVQDDMDKLWDLFDELEQYCNSYGRGYFRLPQCECEQCWLLKDPSTPFHQQCFSQLHPLTQDYIIDYCLKVWDDPRGLEHFLDYVKYLCYYYTYTHVQIPTCIDCTDEMIDLIIIVDVSGSINSGKVNEVEVFLDMLLPQLNIGTDFIQVAIIAFATTPKLILPFTDSKAVAIIEAMKISATVGVGPDDTNIIPPLDMMESEFSTNGRLGSRQIGMIFTDGGHKDVSPNISPSIEMIVIGIDVSFPSSKGAQTLVKIASDANDKRLDDDMEPGGLNSLLDNVEECICPY